MKGGWISHELYQYAKEVQHSRALSECEGTSSKREP